MAFCLSGVMLWVNSGFTDNFFRQWMHSYAIAWPTAFVLVALFGGKMRMLAAALVR